MKTAVLSLVLWTPNNMKGSGEVGIEEHHKEDTQSKPQKDKEHGAKQKSSSNKVQREEIFHWGERYLQEKSGRRDFAQKLGERKLVSQIQEESVEFIRSRQAVFIASLEPQTGKVWCSPIFAEPKKANESHLYETQLIFHDIENTTPASLHASEPLEAPFCDTCGDFAAGNLISETQASFYKHFIQIDSPKHITIKRLPHEKDPLREILKQEGAIVSLNFIEFETRQRYRANGYICCCLNEKTNSFGVTVKEAFSTCPRYIQRRTIEEIHQRTPEVTTSPPNDPTLSSDFVELITSADTLMIATATPNVEYGADSSHKGGRPGFVRVVDRKKLVWGDYHGKSMFQTLGNVIVNPYAGLAFVDFTNGNVLQLSGKMEIQWMGAYRSLDGSCRLVVFDVENWIFTKHASPFRWKFIEQSTHHPILADKPFLFEMGKQIDTAIEKWRQVGEESVLRVELLEVRDESDHVKTLKFKTNRPFAPEPGQYTTFTFQVGEVSEIRCWTLSSAQLVQLMGVSLPPKANLTDVFEISVKKVGVVTDWLFHAKPGLKGLIHGVEGNFTWAASQRIGASLKPDIPYSPKVHWRVMMTSGGIGVTPMMSLLRGMEHMRNSGEIEDDEMPNITALHSEHTLSEMAFREDWKRMTEGDHPLISCLGIAFSRESEEGIEKAKKEFPAAKIFKGHADEKVIEAIASDVSERIVYCCGPNPFMGAIVSALHKKNMNPGQILLENFDY